MANSMHKIMILKVFNDRSYDADGDSLRSAIVPLEDDWKEVSDKDYNLLVGHLPYLVLPNNYRYVMIEKLDDSSYKETIDSIFVEINKRVDKEKELEERRLNKLKTEQERKEKAERKKYEKLKAKFDKKPI